MVSRRGMLTLAALAALPAACSRQAPSLSAAPTSAAPTSASPSPSAFSSLGPAATVTASPKPTPSETEKAAAAQKVKDTGRGGPVSPTAGKVMLGSYLSLSGRSQSESLALRRSQLGRDQRIVHQFWAWDEKLPRTRAGVPSDSTLMISWHAPAWSRITGGGSDQLIAAAARNLGAQGKPLLVRWAWEMNGDWFEWGGANNGKDPGAYVTAWRRIHRIFAEEGADNVSWVWSPNWNDSPAVSWNKMRNYYPGDDYVDWVGVSGYDFYQEKPSTLFDPIVGSYGAKKPIIVSETAAIDFGGSTKADWTDDLNAYARRTPEISALVWFDTDTHNDTNFRIDSTPGALAAYRRMARNSHFEG
ncbi:glycoside hydrolase family 26 protein [Symbioplanes lichenis]|uniref:glycoside hydrolase family 26 protein n=1 Tax=Symbioplanes lichenis TaxID=1629072 RepID=UPI0027399160|nr:glycosyl hydrolase [Actinoplanes lichenis]